MDDFTLMVIGSSPNQFCRNAVVIGVNVCVAVTSIVPTPLGTPSVVVQSPVHATEIVVPAGIPWRLTRRVIPAVSVGTRAP